MGTGASKRSRIRPVTAQISVQPITVQPAPHVEASLDSSGGLKAAGDSDHNSSDKSRPPSSRQNSLSSSARGGSALRRQLHSGKRFTPSRPISNVSKRNSSAKGFGRQRERLISPPAALRNSEVLDFSASLQTQRLLASLDSEVVVLRTDAVHMQEKPASRCQLCGNQFTNLGVRIPLLLLCGHSYCSNCLDKACENYPSALKCGICAVITPLDQQMTENLPKNETILELLASKEYTAISNEKNMELCAECVHEPASVFCSECSASYCNFCGKKAHEGSRVRARHKPVPINLKPRPQPTCKKHPGQSCVLYCETEKTPMCVLCKFYNQHRFHRYELMTKVASKYTNSVTEKLAKLDKIEKELGSEAQRLFLMVDEVNSSARKAQEKLERHFTEMRKSYLASLERREASLLALVDRQVEVKQEMLAELRMEVAAARARVLAAKQEAAKLLQLNPVTALLSRKHMDLSFDRALKQTAITSQTSIQPEVPLSLLPDITPSLVQSLHQHGAVLELPAKPNFTNIQLSTNAISLQWEVVAESSDVANDRTLTYSLHCFADVPFKMKAKLSFKKRFIGKMVTPESGFEEMSELSSESKNTFPSLPPSSLGSRNISLVTLGDKSHDQNLTNQSAMSSHDRLQNDALKTSQLDDNNRKGPDRTTLILKPTGGKTITSLLPEPIRLPQPADATDTKLPQLVVHPVPGKTAPQPTNQNTTPATAHVSKVLNLPPLIIGKRPTCDSETELVSISTSGGALADSESRGSRMSTLGEDGHSDLQKMDSSSVYSDSSDEDECLSRSVNEFTEVGRFCKGYAFEEIYHGEQSSFQYSGMVAGASYYFRVCCHNASGWGPCSDTVKCMTILK